MQKIWRKLSSTIASLFNVVHKYKMFIVLLLKINYKKELGTLLLNQPWYYSIHFNYLIHITHLKSNSSGNHKMDLHAVFWMTMVWRPTYSSKNGWMPRLENPSMYAFFVYLFCQVTFIDNMLLFMQTNQLYWSTCNF
jgi:hypothetical protein